MPHRGSGPFASPPGTWCRVVIFYSYTEGTGTVQVNLTDYVRVRDVYSFDFDRRIPVRQERKNLADSCTVRTGQKISEKKFSVNEDYKNPVNP